MYDALIQNLRSVDEYDTGYAKLIYDAADAIEDLQEKLDDARMDAPEWAESLEYMSAAKVELEEQTRWIPVAERLPEPGWYLVRCNEVYKHIHRIAYYYNHAWYENCINITDFTTHWMPLPSAPEPPKEET